MSQNSTTNQDPNHRRGFLRTAGMVGAALVSSPLLGSLAHGQPVASLQPAELTVAVDLLTEIRQSQRSGLLLLIVEHVATVAATGTAQDVKNALDLIRGVTINSHAKDRDASLETLRSETRKTLSEAVAIETAAANGDPRYV